MSKGPQKRCPWTGERKAIIDDLDEPYKAQDGGFNPDALPDSNLFDIRSISAAAGFKDWRYFRDYALTDTSSCWHLHKHTFTVQRRDGGGERAEIFATATNSAAAGGDIYREIQKKKRRARIPVFMDISSKSSFTD